MSTPPPLIVPPFFALPTSTHPPRVLMLYGSLRERSYSRLLAEEAARVLEGLGCEVRWFHAHDLPMKADGLDSHPEVQRLRDLCIWSEAQVWSCPEMHGSPTGVFKNQIDWIPLAMGAVRPTQGRTLAVMQVCGGSQSFNVVNALRVLGRWMRMITIPNQSSVAKAWQEFDETGHMKDGPFRDRVVDVMEELYKFTLLTRDHRDFLVDRYSERREATAHAAPPPARWIRRISAARQSETIPPIRARRGAVGRPAAGYAAGPTGGPMGVEINSQQPGDGSTFPQKGQTVTVHYTGTLTDGTKFDSSRDRGQPFSFVIGRGQVIKGWDEGVAKLSLGQRATLTCSPDFAYGDRGFPGLIPPQSTLVFDVELLSIR